MKNRKKPYVRNPFHELHDLSWRIQGLAHLLQIVGSSDDPALEKSHWGLGRILENIAKRMATVTQFLEDEELKKKV